MTEFIFLELSQMESKKSMRPTGAMVEMSFCIMPVLLTILYELHYFLYSMHLNLVSTTDNKLFLLVLMNGQDIIMNSILVIFQ